MIKRFVYTLLLMFCSVTIFAQVPDNPCEPGGIHPICMGSNGVSVTYPNTTSGDAIAFLGQNRAGCVSSVVCPSWFYLRIGNPGNLLLSISQHCEGTTAEDVDFICWGPFNATSGADFENKLCNHVYNLNLSGGNSHSPTGGNHENDLGGYPVGNIVDCSYSASFTEWCYIPNAQAGEYYLLCVTNFARNHGYFSFIQENVPYAQGSIDDDLIIRVADNMPVCEGGQLQLSLENASNTGTYTWIAPNGASCTTSSHVWNIPNVTSDYNGRYMLVVNYGTGLVDTTYSRMIEIASTPTVTLTPEDGSIFMNGENVAISATVTNYPEAYFAWNGAALDTVATHTSILNMVTTQDTCITLLVSTNEGCSANDTLCIRVTDVGIDQYATESSVNVYPNPTTGLVKVDMPDEQIDKIEVYDTMGKLVAMSHKSEVDIRNEAEGLYLLKIYTNKGVVTTKVIKK